MDSTWAFCQTSSREDVQRSLRENLRRRLPEATFRMIENPDDFFPDEDIGAPTKRVCKQISYYVATRSHWTALTYATGGDPFELKEPRSVSAGAGRPVVEVTIGEMGDLSIRFWNQGTEVLTALPGDRFRQQEREVTEEVATRALAELFGTSGAPCFADCASSDWDRAGAILSWLGIVQDGEAIDDIEPECAYAEGSIIAFSRA